MIAALTLLPDRVAAQQCLHVGSFDIATTAGALSQLAGVLAGFAFFAVIFVLTNAKAVGRSPTERAHAQFDQALLALFCATFGLAITAIQFAILAGEQNVGLRYGRAASEELMADISLSLSIFTLVAGMLLLIVPSFGRTERVIRILASTGGPPMAVYFVAETCREVAVGIWAGIDGSTLCATNAFYSEIQLWAHTVAPLLVFACALAFWLAPRYLPSQMRQMMQAGADRIRSSVPVIALLAVVAAVSVGVSFDEFHPHSHIGEDAAWIAITATELITLLQAFVIRFPEKRSPPARANSSWTRPKLHWLRLVR
jgi:hypothetical protein